MNFSTSELSLCRVSIILLSNWYKWSRIIEFTAASDDVWNEIFLSSLGPGKAAIPLGLCAP